MAGQLPTLPVLGTIVQQPTPVVMRFPENIISGSQRAPESVNYGLFEVVDASRYSSIMPWHLEQVNAALRQEIPNPRTILEACAHIGAGTVNLARVYPNAQITAVEIEPAVFERLNRNLQTFVPGRVKTILADCTEVVKHTPPVDVVYLAPPWGGPGYEKQTKLMLYLSNAPITDLVVQLFANKQVGTVVIEVPFNFDFDSFNQGIRAQGLISSARPVFKDTSIKAGDIAFYLVFVRAAATNAQPFGREDLFLLDTSPQEEYRRRAGEDKQAVRWGQRKLLIALVEFLTMFWNPAEIQRLHVVYAGAAPGCNIEFVSKMFPAVTFHLWDPAPFGIKPSERINLHQELFTDQIAQQWNGRKDVFFVSDIRSGSYEKIHEVWRARGEQLKLPAQEVERRATLENEQMIISDMELQQRWTFIIDPVQAHLKFRLPWEMQGINRLYEYLHGHVLLQAWTPPTSTETRLVPFRDAEGKYFKRPWDIRTYCNQMFYHNNTVRQNSFYVNPLSVTGPIDSPELLNDYDSTAEAVVLRDYVQSRTQVVSPRPIVALSRSITKYLSTTTKPRTLASLRLAATMQANIAPIRTAAPVRAMAPVVPGAGRAGGRGTRGPRQLEAGALIPRGFQPPSPARRQAPAKSPAGRARTPPPTEGRVQTFALSASKSPVPSIVMSPRVALAGELPLVAPLAPLIEFELPTSMAALSGGMGRRAAPINEPAVTLPTTTATIVMPTIIPTISVVPTGPAPARFQPSGTAAQPIIQIELPVSTAQLQPLMQTLQAPILSAPIITPVVVPITLPAPPVIQPITLPTMPAIQPVQPIQPQQPFVMTQPQPQVPQQQIQPQQPFVMTQPQLPAQPFITAPTIQPFVPAQAPQPQRPFVLTQAQQPSQLFVPAQPQTRQPLQPPNQFVIQQAQPLPAGPRAFVPEQVAAKPFVLTQAPGK
jgi:hypothetical protein